MPDDITLLSPEFFPEDSRQINYPGFDYLEVSDPEERLHQLLVDVIIDNENLKDSIYRLVGGWEIPDGEYVRRFMEGFAAAYVAVEDGSQYSIPELDLSITHTYFQELELFNGSAEDWVAEKNEFIDNNDPEFSEFIGHYIEAVSELEIEPLSDDEELSLTFGFCAAYDFLKYYVRSWDFRSQFEPLMI